MLFELLVSKLTGKTSDAMEEERYRIPFFDGKNFSDWSYRLQLQLDEDLPDHINLPLEELLADYPESPSDTSNARETKAEAQKKIRYADRKCKTAIVRGFKMACWRW